MFYTETLSQTLPELFLHFGQVPGTVWLDSAKANPHTPQFSYLAFDPDWVLTASGNQGLLTTSGTTTSIANVVEWLSESLIFDNSLKAPFPFSGGYLAVVGYEAGAWFSANPVPVCAKPGPLPELILGYYTHVVVWNHHLNQGTYVHQSSSKKDSKPVSFDSILSRYPKQNLGTFQASHPDFETTQAGYETDIDRVLAAIAEGTVYQVNLSHRLSASYKGDVRRFYTQLRQRSASPFGAFMSLPDSGFIASASPEQFFSLHHNTLVSRPIKGTIARGKTPAEDQANAQTLLNHPKENAELTMITDLIRNDLGQVCAYGTVEVTTLKTLETYEQVFHLVSTVQGQVSPEFSALDVLRHLFPGGSVTGTPKSSATQLIAELEPSPRSVYTGAIGFLSSTGDAHFNVAIRTAYGSENQLYFHAGGGIVADSVPAAEWQETLDKAQGVVLSLV
ncbi:MAG: anthranilate synthase component I family protein [Candidatus Margulisiibacteriota bacterium]